MVIVVNTDNRLANTKLLNEYVEVRTELDYIDEVEPQYVDESPYYYEQLRDREHNLRTAILNKMEVNL
jgi:hypothetical protein